VSALGRGHEAFDQGDFAGARAHWEQARTDLPNPRIFRLLGLVALELHDPVEAAGMFRRALSAADNGNPLTPEQQAEIESSLLPNALQHVGELVIEVRPEGATLSIDGQPVEPVDGGSLLVAPGVHSVSSSHPGFEQAQQRIRVAPGVPRHLVIALESRVHVMARHRRQSAIDARDLELGLGTGFTVASGIALVAYATYGSLALAENERLATGCAATSSCVRNDFRELRSLSEDADISLTLGLVVAVPGLALLVAGLVHDIPRVDAETSALRWTPWFGVGAAGVQVSGHVEAL
jgi:hypothetical protein